MVQMTFREVTDRLIALYGERKFEDALSMIKAHLDAFPEQKSRMAFWRMCLLSLSNRPEETISAFRQGLDAGLWWQPELFADPDLNAVRDLPEFQRLMAVSQEKYEDARSRMEREYAILLPEPPVSGRSPLLITLHGRNGNKDVDLGQWELARQRGWLVLSCQSTQPVFQGAYHWDNPATGLADLLYYYEQAAQRHQIDPQRIVIAGFSQGSGMAIYAARQGTIPIRGFIGIGTWWENVNELASGREDIRGYFVTGLQDHTLERAREIQNVLRMNGVPFSEEVHEDIGHQFSADFGASFDKAIEFIFKERE
jgi:predicted esterase